MSPESHHGSTVAPHTEKPPIGETIEVGGRKLFAHLQGSGGPLVVIFPGAGAVGLDYLNLQQRAAEFTSCLVYDRGGTGWSEGEQLPRSAPEVVDEVRALLAAIGVAPPYVLLGHSLGGAFARHFAQRFPTEVAALLFLDPAHEALMAHYPTELRELFAQFEGAPIPELPPAVLEMWRGVFDTQLARWPAAVREPLVRLHAARWRAGFLEGQKTESLVYDPLRQGGGLPQVPLIALSAMGIDTSPTSALPEPIQRGVNAAKQAVNRLLAASVPGGEERALDGATHPWMHIEREDAVVAALEELVARVRR